MQASLSSRGGAVVGGSADHRLAAVVFADIVGYSILMATDEARTHARWMAILNQILRPAATQHNGIVVKSTGDGVLAEFASALDAVEWGTSVQRSILATRGNEDRAEPPIAMRIAVHHGDIISTSDDIYGNSVNVAARLQEHARPGGLVMSEAVYDLVRGSLGAQARDLGYLHLKNLEKPVKAYALDPDVPGIAIPARPQGGTLPSVAVLPFENLGGDPENAYFADGIVEDITVSLAGLHELTVISRGSTLIYRTQQPDPREVGRALGVGYVVTGSLRRSVRSVRVSTQLCDTSNGASLWGDHAEVTPGDVFEVQDRIVRSVVGGIAPHIRAAELRRALRKRPDSFTAYDYTLRALDFINSLDLPRFLQAREFLEKAMAEDPDFAMPAAWAARWYSLYIGQGWSTSRHADAAKAIALGTRAVELDRQNALALATMGHLKSFLFHDCETAMVYFERALAACPNSSLAWILSSVTLAFLGRGEEAVRHAEQGLRLSPFDQSLFYYYNFLGVAHYANSNFVEAVKWSRMSFSENPGYTANLRILIAALAELDRLDEAREVAAELMRREPGFRLGEWERTRQPFREPVIRSKHIQRLRSAGLPA